MFELALILKIVGGAASIWVAGYAGGKVVAWIRAIGTAV